MSLTIILILILIFIILYIVLVEGFTIAFRLTGLSDEKARFQVISLFTNAGFTTHESEIIPSSPNRRRLAIITMVTGHIFSAIIVSLVVSIFTNISTINEMKDHSLTILISLGVLFLLLIILKVPFISKPLSKGLENLAISSMQRRPSKNIITELDNYGNFSITEVLINEMPSKLVDKPLFETDLKNNYRINLLILKRKNKVLEVSANTILQKGDLIVVFGPLQSIKDLFTLTKKEHKELVENLKEKRNEITIIDNYGKEAMVEILINKIPEFLKEKTLFESKLKEKFGLNVMMLKRNGDIVDISKDTVFLLNDVIIVFGEYKEIKHAFLEEN